MKWEMRSVFIFTSAGVLTLTLVTIILVGQYFYPESSSNFIREIRTKLRANLQLRDLQARRNRPSDNYVSYAICGYVLLYSILDGLKFKNQKRPGALLSQIHQSLHLHSLSIV